MAEPTPAIDTSTPVEPAVPVPSPTAEVDGGAPDPLVEPAPGPQFADAAPEPWRDAAWARDIKSQDALWDKAGNALKSVGKKGVVLPGDNDAADVARAFKELGRPDDVAGYELNFETPDIAGWNPAVQESMVEAMHHAGLNSKQVDILLSSYADQQGAFVTDANAAIESHRESVRGDLQKEWGTAYSHKANLARTTAESVLGEKFEGFSEMTLSDGTPLGDSPLILSMFAAIGEQWNERPGVPAAGMGGNSGVLTPDIAAAEAKAFRTANALALNTKGHLEHDDVVEKLWHLTQMANPEPEA